MESIKSEFEGGLSLTYKTFSLEQQNSPDDSDSQVWEHPDRPSRGLPALAAAQSAKNQGEELFLKYHLAAFEARHKEGLDTGDVSAVKEIAALAGLDMDRFDKDMEDQASWEAVGKDHIESKEKYNTFGVPTLVFEGDRAVFVKLMDTPDSKEENLSLLKLICEMGGEMPYLLELKRP